MLIKSIRSLAGRPLSMIGASMFVATSAVGGGAFVSGQAIAEPITQEGPATVTGVIMVNGGQPVSCTFTGDSAQALLPPPAAGASPPGISTADGGQGPGAPTGGLSVTAGKGTGAGEVRSSFVTGTRAEASGPEAGAVLGNNDDGEATRGFVVARVGSADGGLPPLPTGVDPADVTVVDVADARQGTSEECAAMLDTIAQGPVRAGAEPATSGGADASDD